MGEKEDMTEAKGLLSEPKWLGRVAGSLFPELQAAYVSYDRDAESQQESERRAQVVGLWSGGLLVCQLELHRVGRSEYLVRHQLSSMPFFRLREIRQEREVYLGTGDIPETQEREATVTFVFEDDTRVAIPHADWDKDLDTSSMGWDRSSAALAFAREVERALAD